MVFKKEARREDARTQRYIELKSLNVDQTGHLLGGYKQQPCVVDTEQASLGDPRLCDEVECGQGGRRHV